MMHHLPAKKPAAIDARPVVKTSIKLRSVRERKKEQQQQQESKSQEPGFCNQKKQVQVVDQSAEYRLQSSQGMKGKGKWETRE